MLDIAAASTAQKIPLKRDLSVVCGPDRDRTGYLLIANEALYQVSYGPRIQVKAVVGVPRIGLGFRPPEGRIIPL